jgi:hypothetical protein
MEDVSLDFARLAVAVMFALIGFAALIAGFAYIFSGCLGLLQDAWRQLPLGFRNMVRRWTRRT